MKKILVATLLATAVAFATSATVQDEPLSPTQPSTVSGIDRIAQVGTDHAIAEAEGVQRAREVDRSIELMNETVARAHEHGAILWVAEWERQVIEYLAAEAEAERQRQAALERQRQQQRQQQAPRSVAPQGPTQGSGRCGGDLPPCYVMQRESGGDIRIWNGGCYAPVGHQGRSPCGVSSASGKWQFVRGTWGGFGGYVNAADAPESVQDERARQLWAGGRGCGHWAAC